MNDATEQLLLKHQRAARTALEEAARLANGLIVTLGGCDSRNEFVELDLTAAEVTIRRLKELQRTVIDESQAVQRLNREAMG